MSSSDTAHTRTLRRAAELAGSVESLAALLGVRHSDLSQWMAGVQRLPTEVYLRALDVVARGAPRR